MARKTAQHDRFVEALVGLGARIVGTSNVGDNTVLTRHDGQPGFYFVSPWGALRVGYSVTECKSVPAATRSLILLAHEKSRSGADPA